VEKVESYIEEYQSLELHKIVDYDKFNQYAITAHSTQIEGSTLSIEEASLLINEGITPKGKPLLHSLMVKDHHNALQLAIKLGQKSTRLSLQIICDINETVMKNTGQTYNTALGVVDSAKGELRKGAVFVQNRYFPSHDKVPNLINKLCAKVNEQLVNSLLTVRKQIDLAYSTHFNLVSIHPHYDGNGRTSRLVMNMIQRYFKLPLSIVNKEDKIDYFDALESSRKEETLAPFITFMDNQYIKYLSNEINRFKTQTHKNNKGEGMTLLF